MKMPEKDDLAKDLLNKFKFLKRIRQPYEAEVDQVIKFVDHSVRTINEKNKGTRTGRDVYDGTAISALNMMVDGIAGYLCSRNLKWFRYTLPVKYKWANGVTQRLDNVREVKLWLQDCEDVAYSAFARSNFYDNIPQFIRGGGGVGTSHQFIEEDVGKGRINFLNSHFRENYIAENGFGLVDTNFRCYKETLRNMVDMFGLDEINKIDVNFAESYKKNPYDEREIIHAIFPRKDRDPSIKNNKNKSIASVWLYKDEVVKESGYDSMPKITWRWRKNNDELYGRSPSWDALIDIMLANQQGRSNLQAAHKMVEPAMFGPAFLRGNVSTTPNAWNFIEDGMSVKDNMPQPLHTVINLPFSVEMQDRVRATIEDHYAVKFFLALTQAAADKTELTATQVLEMMGEKAAILTTRVGMFESEGLDATHERVFTIESKAGRMPDPPDIVYEAMDGEVEVEYLGPLAQAQMYLNTTRTLRSGIQMIAEIANVEPASIDYVDFDETMKDVLYSIGFPEKRLRSDEEVMKIRQQRADQIAQQQALAAAEPLAKAGRMAGFAPEQGSPMEKVMSEGE